MTTSTSAGLPRPPRSPAGEDSLALESAHASAHASASETHRLVRERVFPHPLDVPAILHLLRQQSATGTLTIDLNQGGVGSIRFREERRIHPQ